MLEFLTEAQQEAITEAGKLASEHCKKISAEAEAEVLEALKADGCNVVDVTDKGPWQEACSSAPAIKEAIDKQADLYHQILDLK